MLGSHVAAHTAGAGASPRREGCRAAGIGAAVLIAALAVEVTGRQAEPAAGVLERLQRRYASTEAFSCRFEQTKRIRQIEGDVRLHGDLLFQKPHFLKMRITGDDAFEVYANGRTAWLVDRRAGDVHEFNLGNAAVNEQLARMLPPFVLYSFQDLERQFSALVRTAGGTTTVALTPKPGSRLPYSVVELEVDSLDRPRRAVVQYVNGDRIDTTFRGWERLPRVSTHIFDFVRK